MNHLETPLPASRNVGESFEGGRAERIADKYVDVVSGDDGTRFVRVKTEWGWTLIVSPSGDDLAQYQANAIRNAIAAAAHEIVEKRPQTVLQRIAWAFLWW